MLKITCPECGEPLLYLRAIPFYDKDRKPLLEGPAEFEEYGCAPCGVIIKPRMVYASSAIDQYWQELHRITDRNWYIDEPPEGDGTVIWALPDGENTGKRRFIATVESFFDTGDVEEGEPERDQWEDAKFIANAPDRIARLIILYNGLLARNRELEIELAKAKARHTVP